MKLFIYLFTSCNGGSKSVSIKSSKLEKKRDTSITSKSKKSVLDKPVFDTLLISQVRFNNHLFKRKYSTIIKKKTDSIVDALSIPNSSWECGNPFDWKEDFLKIIYVRNQKYISNKKEAFLYYAKFEGTNEIYLEKGKHKLNKHTTIEDFKKIFKHVEIQEIESGYVVYNITFNPKQPEDNWIFYFDKESHLVEFYLSWWLC
ncbi:hypothetical protein [Tenacibaculum ovolyticum]|uniref:hypothetical protein n=1 Tax=Tenacibaculum ovolyticum TaxID=104270 RepID=UPI0007EC358A|nr:hypothetical protein [Tenacibaculum ovolyticum]